MKAECPQCRRLIGSYIPKNGDGSLRYFRSHLCFEINYRRGKVSRWTCVRVHAEVPRFQMRPDFRSTGEEKEKA